MIKFAFVESVSRQYLQMQKNVRRNHKMYSSAKLAITIAIFLAVLCVYAWNVTQSSTKWYFHREASQELSSLEFDMSIVNLDKLMAEKRLLTEVSWNNSKWYASNVNRTEVVYTYDSELVFNNR